MSKTTIEGFLHKKSDAIQVSDKFQKRDFVIKVQDGQYQQFISVQLTNDKTSLIDNVNVGDALTAHINIQGREWTSPQGEVKYFNTLTCWKIDASPSTATNGAQQAAAPVQNAANPTAPDGLPF